MAWIHRGRKYWYHNGKRYSRRLKRKRNNGYFVAPKKIEKSKHDEAMEFRKVLLRENREVIVSPMYGDSVAITATDDEILKIKKSRENNYNKKEDNNNFWAF